MAKRDSNQAERAGDADVADERQVQPRPHGGPVHARAPEPHQRRAADPVEAVVHAVQTGRVAVGGGDQVVEVGPRENNAEPAPASTTAVTSSR